MIDINKICELADSTDIECKKLAMGLLQSEFPNKLSYHEYLKVYQNWIFKDEYIYFLEEHYFDFLIIGYCVYLGIIPVTTYKM